MSSSHPYVLVLSTVPDEKVAITLAREIIELQLAACVNILPHVRSVYRWQERIHDEPEVQLLLKTSRNKENELIEWLKTNHPYKVPEIIVLPIIAGNENYFRWVDEQTARK